MTVYTEHKENNHNYIIPVFPGIFSHYGSILKQWQRYLFIYGIFLFKLSSDGSYKKGKCRSRYFLPKFLKKNLGRDEKIGGIFFLKI
ncbi:MAG: hypothetical protein IPP72_21325 [Chitinophagaceae bacterium]|nr:hypothetical protein [Chitinophagaceae bacterium]